MSAEYDGLATRCRECIGPDLNHHLLMEYPICEFVGALREQERIQQSDILEMTMRRNRWMVGDELTAVDTVVSQMGISMAMSLRGFYDRAA